MKLLVSFALASFAAVPAFASEPNLFSCTGEGITVTYATSGFDARPTLQIARRGVSPVTFRGEQIESSKSLIGEAASVVEQRAFDAYTKTSSLLVPTVNVNGFIQVKNVPTVLLTTTSYTTIAGPDIIEGVVVEHTSVNLTCTVSAVNF